MSDWTLRLPIARDNCWDGGRTGMCPARAQFANCVLRNDALHPGTCPFPKHAVLFNTILNSGDNAPFCLLVISRKEKRQLIKAIQILVTNLAKLLSSRVAIFTASEYLTVGLRGHFLTSRELHGQSPVRLRRRRVWSRTPQRLHEGRQFASLRRHAQ